MTIRKDGGGTAADEEQPLRNGWLEFDARWLAGLFGLQGTGEARVMLGKVQVGVLARDIKSGDVLEGHFMHAVVPTGVTPKGQRLAVSAGRESE